MSAAAAGHGRPGAGVPGPAEAPQGDAPGPAGPAGETGPAVELVRFPVRGMTCGSCVNRITRSLRAVPGVTKVSVDLRHETATVRREPGQVPDASLAAAVAAAGYEADLAAAELLPPVEQRSLLDRLLHRGAS